MKPYQPAESSPWEENYLHGHEPCYHWSITKQAYHRILQECTEVGTRYISRDKSHRFVVRYVADNDFIWSFGYSVSKQFGVRYHAGITRSARNRLVKSKWNSPWAKDDTMLFTRVSNKVK